MRLKDNPFSTFHLRNLFWLFAAYVLLSAALYLHEPINLYISMVWNVFLALLPLIFATWIIRMQSKLSWVPKIVFGALWVVFFPNSLYMITDFIHISGDHFYLGQEEYDQIIVTASMTLWVRIAYIGIGALMGILAGLLSMRMVHFTLSRTFGKASSGLFLIAIFLLTGLGIYVGRFLRLNSWNIVHPRTVLAEIYDSLSLFSIKFIALYSFMTCALYFIFCALYPIVQQQEEE